MNATRTSPLSLYDVGMEAMQIEELLLTSEGELSPELEQRWNDLLTAGKDKINSAACVVRSLEASAEACKQEAARLAERHKAIQADADRLKERIKVAVDLAFNGKVKTPLFTVYNQTSAPSYEFVFKTPLKAGDLPEQFMRVPEPEVRKRELIDAWKAGDFIPDSDRMEIVELPGKRSLRIR